MTVVPMWCRWEARRYRLFQWRVGLSLGRRLLLCLGVASLTGLLAQVRIPLSFTPVPVTGQVFGVLLAGVLMGRNGGAFSQMLYVGLGATGVPWFAGGASGGLLGPTGGYLIGFVPAAALVGWLTDRHIHLRGMWGQAVLMMAGVAVIYVCGAVQFAVVMGAGLRATLWEAVLPFIPVDFVKALGVAITASALLPKVSFTGAVDQATRRER